MSDNNLVFFNLSISLFSWKDTINKEINVDLFTYYSEMEYKENYRKVMTTCVRKVYDNDNKYYVGC